MAHLTGACLCGAVKFELSADPVFQFACHCTDCQRASGGAPTLGMAFPEPALTITQGTPKDFVSAGDTGGKVKRSFCETCGSPLFSRPDVTPGMVIVKIGALDDPSAFKPQIDMFMASARPWHQPHEGAARFDRNPG
jgi:hypothetical protein